MAKGFECVKHCKCTFWLNVDFLIKNGVFATERVAWGMVRFAAMNLGAAMPLASVVFV